MKAAGAFNGLPRELAIPADIIDVVRNALLHLPSLAWRRLVNLIGGVAVRPFSQT
jgi:hypothetical protein